MPDPQEIAYTIGSIAGQIAQAYAPDSSVGRAGGVGASVNQALLIQKQQEEERKKKEDGGTLGKIGAAAGSVLGFTVGGPVGASIGSAAGGALGKEIGGGDGFDPMGLFSDAFAGYGYGTFAQQTVPRAESMPKSELYPLEPPKHPLPEQPPAQPMQAPQGNQDMPYMGRSGGTMYHPQQAMQAAQVQPQGLGNGLLSDLKANTQAFFNYNLNQRRTTEIDPRTGGITIRYGGGF